jgi:hypothetical protein
MKKICFILAFLTAFAVNAQNDMDAFRFSQTQWEGTARFMGAGGAFGAVGAEYSALAVNPASIGLYKRSEVTFTPFVLTVHQSQSTYNGLTFPYLATTYSLSNAGVVVKAGTKEESAWKAVQFAVGYNRVNNFNNQFRINGMSNGSSMINEFIKQAGNTDFKNLTRDASLAFYTWLIDTIPGTSNSYYSPFIGTDVEQKKYVKTSGGIDEMNFSIGANYNEQIYIGATLGIPFLKYREEAEYSETDVNEVAGGLGSFSVSDILRVSGTGINVKLGLIYQPVHFFRVGVAFHSPTYYGNMKDRFERTVASCYDDGNNFEDSYENSFRYKLTTPLRAVGSMAFMIQKRAFISADYEFIHYGLATMDAQNYSFSQENQDIQDKYGATHAIRVGAELFLTDKFLVRAGYGFTSNPYKRHINSSPIHSGSAGIGIRTKYLFFDLAYAIKFAKENYWMYNPLYVNHASNQYMAHKIVATIGVKF